MAEYLRTRVRFPPPPPIFSNKIRHLSKCLFYFGTFSGQNYFYTVVPAPNKKAFLSSGNALITDARQFVIERYQPILYSNSLMISGVTLKGYSCVWQRPADSARQCTKNTILGKCAVGYQCLYVRVKGHPIAEGLQKQDEPWFAPRSGQHVGLI